MLHYDFLNVTRIPFHHAWQQLIQMNENQRANIVQINFNRYRDSYVINFQYVINFAKSHFCLFFYFPNCIKCHVAHVKLTRDKYMSAYNTLRENVKNKEAAFH